MELELERTYLLKYCPENLEDFESAIIDDVYFPADSVHPALRIRNRNNKSFEMTKKINIKANDSSEKEEHTISFSEEEYKAFSLLNGKQVKKRRYYFICNTGQKAEIDIFMDDLEGLATVDFEFLSVEEKNNFSAPDFCLAEITQEEWAPNGILAGKKYSDIEGHLQKYGYKKFNPMEGKLKKIQSIVEKELWCSAHNIDHVMRVYNLALHIGEGENVDRDVLKAAALLHDIAGAKEQGDPTGNTDHAVLGAEMAGEILNQLSFPSEKIKHIQDCILSHRYRTNNKPQTLEAKILFDADKLDAVGAIGVARAYVWVGRNNANIYKKVDDINEYVKENYEGGEINGRIKDRTIHSPQIEFETKIKFLSDGLFTQRAKEICAERVEYKKNFLDRLEREIKGEI